MKFKIVILFYILLSVHFSAQNTELPPPAQAVIDTLGNDKQDMIPADSVLVSTYTTKNETYPKTFDNQLNSKYKSNDFNYEIIKPQDSLWNRIKRNIAKFLSKIFGDLDPASANRYTMHFLRVLGIVAFGFLMYFLIKYLISKDGNFFFSKKNVKTNLSSKDFLEDIHEINFQKKITSYEAEKDYRSALRYQFLYVLKTLSDKGKIKWTPEKTNQDYASELKDDTQNKQFKVLAYIFENAWYGDFVINENDYEFYKNKFINSKF